MDTPPKEITVIWKCFLLKEATFTGKNVLPEGTKFFPLRVAYQRKEVEPPALTGKNFLTQGSRVFLLTLLRSEQPKLYGVLAVPSAIGLRVHSEWPKLYGFLAVGSAVGLRVPLCDKRFKGDNLCFATVVSLS